jgi:hypothetical protein
MQKATELLASTGRRVRNRLVVVAANELSDEDVAYVQDILIMRLALYLDLTTGTTNAEKSALAFRRSILSLKTLDVKSYASGWKALRGILTSPELRKLYPDAQACRQHFKHAAQKEGVAMWQLQSVLSLVEGDDWFGRVNNWIVFDSRSNLKSLDLAGECAAEYLEFERTLECVQQSDLLRTMQRAARDLFGEFNIRNYPFRPKHGSGSTAYAPRAVSDPWHKNRGFAVDSEVKIYCQYRTGSPDWKQFFYYPYNGLVRTCELVMVPKAMTANRTISREPVTLQYLQQDVAAALDDYFRQYCGDFIDLHDQERSRRLAKQGSQDGGYSTIDLSSASDSVTVSLVEAVFSGLPLLYPLMATRSTHVDVPCGESRVVVEMKKFAPMGSSTCFPTECMIFSLVCEAAIRLQTGRRSRKLDYVVYGDDIVVRTEYAAMVQQCLRELGFKVNLEKSFIDDGATCPHTFREACGGEYLDGVDITPLRLSRRLVSITCNDASRLAAEGMGLVDLINRSYLYRFWHLHRYLNDVLSKHKWFRTLLRVPLSEHLAFQRAADEGRRSYVRTTLPYVITDDTSATQWRAHAHRSSKDSPIQENEVLVTCVRAPRQRQYQDENDYFTWCISAVAKKDVDENIYDAIQMVTLRPRGLKWSRKWVQVSTWTHPSRTPSSGVRKNSR